MEIFWLLALLFVIAATVTAAWAGWRAAPFVPTLGRDVQRMLDLADLKPNERLIDLGAGDGRIITEAVRRQPTVTAVGYELSLGMWLVAWLRIGVTGTRRKARMVFGDFFHADLSPYDVVFCFLTPAAMKKLEPKLRTELRPGARIVSAVFPLPDWTPDEKDKPTGRVSIYRYHQS